MSLVNLLQIFRHVRKHDPAAKGLDWAGCARLALIEHFGAEPTLDEVEELAQAAAAAAKADDAFFGGWEPDDEDTPDRQTGGGIRVIRKPEPFGG